MKSLFPGEAFTEFGPSYIHPPGFVPVCAHVNGRTAQQLRSGVRQAAPKWPGIYGMIDRRGVLIYVGKAKSLRSRLLSYFRVKSRDPKAGRILARTVTIVWETSTDEFAALIRELEIIGRFRPRLNVVGQPGSRRYVYICVGRAPAPYAFVTREPPSKASAVYGPLKGAAQVRVAVRQLNDSYGLRDCSQRQPMVFADQQSLFASDISPGCLRYEIGTCLGPCAGHCTRRRYSENVRGLQNFLSGGSSKLIGKLNDEMERASSRLEYERAMLLRDKIADLNWLIERLVWLRRARLEHSCIYPLQGPDQKIVWYFIECGQVRAAFYPPRDDHSCRAIAKRIDEIYATPSHAETMVPRGRIDSVLLVAAWFRKRPDERSRCIDAEQARTACEMRNEACAKEDPSTPTSDFVPIKAKARSR